MPHLPQPTPMVMQGPNNVGSDRSCRRRSYRMFATRHLARDETDSLPGHADLRSREFYQQNAIFAIRDMTLGTLNGIFNQAVYLRITARGGPSLGPEGGRPGCNYAGDTTSSGYERQSPASIAFEQKLAMRMKVVTRYVSPDEVAVYPSRHAGGQIDRSRIVASSEFTFRHCSRCDKSCQIMVAVL